jgi:hypothetical protein
MMMIYDELNDDGDKYSLNYYWWMKYICDYLAMISEWTNGDHLALNQWI